MSDLKEVIVPDIGSDEVEIIEICVQVGDTLEAEDSILTVETDKATMDIPAPFAGIVQELKVSVGDKISQGTLIAMMASSDAQATAPAPTQQAAPAPAASVASAVIEVKVPNIDTTDAEIIEVLVAVGDQIDEDTSVITVETDKASMDVPSPFAGTVQEVCVQVGDKVSEGSLMLKLATVSASTPAPVSAPAPTPVSAPAPVPVSAPAPVPVSAPAPVPVSAPAPVPAAQTEPAQLKGSAHASPSVRRISTEFGVDLAELSGSGRKGRIVKQDVQTYVKTMIARAKSGGGSGNFSVIDGPKVDFAKFGAIEEVPLTRIQKISGPNLHRNWVTIPHVTQFDEADITELEAFRKDQNSVLGKQEAGFKITPLVFMMKAVAKTLLQFPVFNSSLSADGLSLIQKKYVHIGVAVDTPNGLVVPVIRDVDQKGIYELSKELLEASKKARQGKLTGADMQGSCFTISSLGGIGGTAFTPIVNAPDVAILGVSKSEMKPKWDGQAFQPRLMLPLSLSYDHRVIDGALAAKFSVTLSGILSDIRKIIL
jgi:pyruvate dehydrogenase E2 component (dihydrolipoamide acetyltransferase)